MKPEKKKELKNIVEGALLAAGRPLNVEEIQALFSDEERPEIGRASCRERV